MTIPTAITTLLSLAGKPGSRPFDRLERGKPTPWAKEAVEKSGLKPLAQGALYLYFDCFEEAHTIANDHEGSLEGNWIHAILHRREPDAGNSKYWYARVNIPAKVSQGIAQETLKVFGTKPIQELENFQKKLAKAGEWAPEAFVDLCEKYRKEDRKTPAAQSLVQIQEIEWRGLIEHILSA